MEQLQLSIHQEIQLEAEGNNHVLLGSVLMMINAGVHSLAGLGGGGPHITLLILSFGLLPKEATIVVFACIFGTAFGSTVNQMRRALNNRPVINYSYTLVTIPLMTIGAILGVFVNRLLPSLATVSIIVGLSAKGLPKMWNRFNQAYQKQSLELEQHRQMQRLSGVIKQSKVNPFQSQFNRRIFKQLGLLILCLIGMSLLKGSSKIPSILGVQNCSILFWILQVAMFALAWYFYRVNLAILLIQKAPEQQLSSNLIPHESLIIQKEALVIKNSIGAGVLSGLGLGGGVLMIPLYRQLGLSQVQASSTGAFNVFVTGIINIVQALSIGILSFSQFIFFFGVSAFGSFVISWALGVILRKKHRLSLIELLLGILIVIICLTVPYSLWSKVEEAHGNWSVILGFGSLC